ncbi:MAG TPA: HlyD family efflux transporter periplasmic adaptor subunit, partial [Propionibacteriaceae bacterium]|nr:HlyD family efflux transporter periplasmic adaptor subunit [Propionibacteriaceae bacterium]
LRSDAELGVAQKAVSDAQRAVRSAEIALSTARSGATAARANNSQRVSTQDSQVALLDATIRSLRDKIDQGRLRAAVDGVVSRMDAVEDQYPQLGDSIVVEGAVGYVASLDVAQADSVGVRPGQTATVTLKGIGTTFTGTVAAVAPVAEKSATSADQHPKVTVEVSVLDPDDTVRVGYEADVEVLLEDKAQTLTLSPDAVRRDPTTGNTYAWVVDERNRLNRVFVRTGIETADEVEVLSGLEEGQDCVLDPDDGLTEGETVRIAGGRRP